MATITLSSNKINQMPGLIKDVKKSVNSYKSELFTLKSKALTINNSVCNMDDVISSIQSSSQTQEQKVTSLDNLSQNIDEFVSDVVRIDGNVADTVNQRKDDFYDVFSYLKPECEKSGWEKFKDGCKKVAEWCKEHWKELVIGLICISIGALLTALTGGTFLAAFLAGLKAAAIAGLISGGISAGISIIVSIINGNDFGVSLSNALNAFGDGFASGFMWGGIFAGGSMALSSGFRFAMAKFPQVSQKLLSNGKIREFVLKRLVPKGAKNTFKPSSNIKDGYKYDIKISKIFGKSKKFQLKWHSLDLKAYKLYPGGNSGAGWTAQIKIGKKLLESTGAFVSKPNNLTHIPIIRWKWW